MRPGRGSGASPLKRSAARASTTWAAPESIASRTFATSATTEVHPGGMYLLKGVGSSTARGTFREVVPVHRLAYSFGWEGNEEVSPGSSLIEIDLIEQDGGTLLRMTHSGLPNAATQASHGKGWAHYLGRLTEAASGRDPGPDRGPNGTRNVDPAS